MSNDNAALLSKIPPGVHRVQVIDEFGRQRYKKPSEVADTDTVCKDGAGEPIVMSGKPGRPKRPEFEPANEKIGDLLRLKEEHLRDDPLLGTLSTNPDSGDVLDYVMRGIASEAASLEFERFEAERTGSPTSQISMRRINALKAVGDSWLKRREQLAGTGVDLESAAFKRLFAFILETFRVVLEAQGWRPEAIETLFSTFAKRLDDDWKREATKRITEG
jgi:hypothetical protein